MTWHDYLIIRLVLTWLLISIIIIINVVVPSESKLSMATCNWARAIIQMQATRDGVNGQHCLAFG